MGISQIREAFNQAAGGKASCTAARLRYVSANGHPMWQQLEFDGNSAPYGAPFALVADPVAPNADLLAVAAAQAAAFIKTISGP
jgi:hypothetical protein